jgi:hypothetical protein
MALYMRTTQIKYTFFRTVREKWREGGFFKLHLSRRLLNNTIASGSIFTCRLHRSPWGDRCGVLRESVCVCFNLSANHILKQECQITVVEQAFSSTRTRPDNNAVSHPDTSYEQWSAWSYSIQLDAVLLDTNDNEIGRLVVKDTIEPLEAVGQVP